MKHKVKHIHFVGEVARNARASLGALLDRSEGNHREA